MGLSQKICLIKYASREKNDFFCCVVYISLSILEVFKLLHTHFLDQIAELLWVNSHVHKMIKL